MSNTAVAHVVVEMIVAIADQAGLSLDELCSGLPVDAHTLRRRLGGLEWELTVELFERIEARVGAEHLLRLATTPREISPIGRVLLGRFLSPRTLLVFVCRVVGPAMYPMYALSYVETEREDGSLGSHFSVRLHDGLRGCRPLFAAHAAAMLALPTFIGQPPFTGRAETTDRGCDVYFELRPATPAPAR